MSNPSSVNPKTRKAYYWNAQGVRHIHGNGKPVSVEYAEKCFKNSVKYGGIAARYNLVLMINSGCISYSKNELKNHLDYLEENGFINSKERQLFDCLEQPANTICSISEIENLPCLSENPETIHRNGVLITLRTHLDSKLRAILKQGNCYDKIDKKRPMSGDLIRIAKDNKLIDKIKADDLFKFTHLIG